MFSCGPIIGVVLAMPDSSVEIAYYQVSSVDFPQVQTVLDALVTIIGYMGAEITGGPIKHRYNPVNEDCDAPSVIEVRQ